MAANLPQQGQSNGAAFDQQQYQQQPQRQLFGGEEEFGDEEELGDDVDLVVGDYSAPFAGEAGAEVDEGEVLRPPNFMYSSFIVK